MTRAPTELRTPRLVLRRWRDADRAPFAAMNADPRVTELLSRSLSAEESAAMISRIERSFEETAMGLWAIERADDARFIGFVGLIAVPFETHFTPAVEIGWRLAADTWGNGYAMEAATETLRDGFERLALDEIVSMTVLANRRSWRVMERLGMGRNAGDDFDHPRMDAGHPLRRHVLYRLTRARWLAEHTSLDASTNRT